MLHKQRHVGCKYTERRLVATSILDLRAATKSGILESVTLLTYHRSILFTTRGVEPRPTRAGAGDRRGGSASAEGGRGRHPNVEIYVAAVPTRALASRLFLSNDHLPQTTCRLFCLDDVLVVIFSAFIPSVYLHCLSAFRHRRVSLSPCRLNIYAERTSNTPYPCPRRHYHFLFARLCLCT